MLDNMPIKGCFIFCPAFLATATGTARRRRCRHVAHNVETGAHSGRYIVHLYGFYPIIQGVFHNKLDTAVIKFLIVIS